jgi:hypothetical protein
MCQSYLLIRLRSEILLSISSVIFALFLVLSSTLTFSEGQMDTHSIKITSPTKGQNISTHRNLTISGNTTNISNGARCYVSVIVNNIRPYQNATADGPKGVNDYSKWHYTVLPTNFTFIKDGQNKLTGKLSCLMAGNSNTNSTSVSNTTNHLIKWYSVNVTGVSNSTSPMANRNNQTVTNASLDRPQQPPGNITISSSNTAKSAAHINSTSDFTSQNQKKDNSTNNATLGGGSITARLTQSPPASKYSYNNNNNAKPLSISIQSFQNIVNGRGASSVTGTAYDAATGKKIDNAIVKLKITFASNGTSKEIIGHHGEVAYSIDINPNSKNNSDVSFKATVQASAPGYLSTSKTTTSSSSSSSSSSTSTSTSTSNNHQGSIINNSG